jgi:glutamate synthase domain-containing protein 2
VESPDLASRIKAFKDWQSDGYGEVIVQANVEDTRLGVQEHAINELGVRTVELKWGQGAKDIGGEVKIDDLEKAQLLKSRDYIVLPDPFDEDVIDAFRRGNFKEFERHSRIGMVDERGFADRVSELREVGAEYVFLKTGAYRPADLARAVKYSSSAKIDLLTVDAAGGGTGMSPWRMMNEWGIPQVEIYSLLYGYLETLARRGEYVPDVVIAGGFTLEDQIFKGLAMGSPYFKAIGMARSPLAAAMVGKTIGKAIEGGQIPVYIERFGSTAEEIFVTAPELKHRFGSDFDRIPTAALGVYTYMERLSQGLRQLMCGNRKFKLDLISRDDIAALTPDAARISGIEYIMDMDREEVDRILKG